jgi:MFS superfamily sulfate permease-like transporter
MRTALFLVVGVLLLAAFLLLGRLFSANYPGATVAATIAYIALWFVIAGANMWIGVAKAGYSVTEELPIFLLIFGLPAAAAVALKWKFL